MSIMSKINFYANAIANKIGLQAVRLKTPQNMEKCFEFFGFSKAIFTEHDWSFLNDVEKQEVVTDVVNGIVQVALPKIHQTVSWGDRLLTLDKSMGFMEDERFKAVAGEVIPHMELDQYNGSHGMAWRLNTLIWAARQTLSLPGAYVELGVFEGDMSWVVLNTLNAHEIDRKFYLYDTFEGFSEKYSSPDDFKDNPGFFAHASERYNISNLYDTVRKRFSRFDNVEVIKGQLPDILDEKCPEQIAFLHMDLNSPKAETATLDRLYDLIVPGGMIVYDDYGWKLFSKQKEAADAFMLERSLRVLELPNGQGLVVKPLG